MSSGLYPYHFFYTTCTIFRWGELLIDDRFSKILIESFRFHVFQNRIIIYGFVIMPDHFHILYQVKEPFTNSDIKQSLLGFTSKEMLNLMSEEEKAEFYVEKNNRLFQIWKSPSLSVDIFSEKFLFQKLNYIHNNPTKANLVANNREYKWSSYLSYLTKRPQFDFLTLLKFNKQL